MGMNIQNTFSDGERHIADHNVIANSVGRKSTKPKRKRKSKKRGRC